MNIQKISASNVSFGIKVPTKEVINLVSGNNSEEATNVFLKLTGLNKDKMLTTMNSDVIQFSKDQCAEELIKIKPELGKLAKAREELIQFINSSLHQTNGGKLSRVNELFDAREAEKTKLLETLPEELDIPQIKLPI